MQKLFSIALGLLLCSSFYWHHQANIQTFTFTEPVDAISFKTNSPTVHAEILVQNIWQTLEVETEFDPKLRVTNLVVFNTPVQSVTIRGETKNLLPQPIRLHGVLPSYTVAAQTNIAAPRILTRRQWGADESFLIAGSESVQPANTTSAAVETEPTARDAACEQLQALYPNDFKTNKTVTVNDAYKPLRWPQIYSPTIHTLVVHHTASLNSTDTRTGWERMQALYAYHANNRGWGDVGYNYIIDADGQIYEGRAGGDYVVGGHAYCNNVGTMGIALMGNFNSEKPTTLQTKSLQWLLIQVSEKYNINLKNNVQYHGKSQTAIIGHRDVTQTACPGDTLYSGLSQIRTNVARGTFSTVVTYPNPKIAQPTKTVTRTTVPVITRSPEAFSIRSNGPTSIIGRPGGSIHIPLVITTGNTINKRSRVALVSRSNNQIGIWQRLADGTETRIRNEIIATETLQANTSSALQLRAQFPAENGSYTITIGTLKFTLISEGRRSKAADNIDRKPVSTTTTKAVSQRGRSNQIPVATPITQGSKPTLFPSRAQSLTSPLIRIKLSYEADSAQIDLGPSGGQIQGTPATGMVTITRIGTQCKAVVGTQTFTSSALQMNSKNDSIHIRSWQTKFNTFRGTIECRVADNKLIFVNELPLEQYLWGLSEEPDTEPYEKQRAFAIAARSYASHYLQSAYRKFPGQPYDGNDSPANFQKYSGKNYEASNPNWLQAVNSTSGIVVSKNNQIVKTPYYSSNDGRTRSPAENGWSNFLFAEVFTSKKDPWCKGLELRGHGVGMSGCGAKGQAVEGKTAEQILKYYYPTTTLTNIESVLKQ